jgi:hypothetical protein
VLVEGEQAEGGSDRRHNGVEEEEAVRRHGKMHSARSWKWPLQLRRLRLEIV